MNESFTPLIPLCYHCHGSGQGETVPVRPILLSGNYILNSVVHFFSIFSSCSPVYIFNFKKRHFRRGWNKRTKAESSTISRSSSSSIQSYSLLLYHIGRWWSVDQSQNAVTWWKETMERMGRIPTIHNLETDMRVIIFITD